jgi:hypothetical protein
MTNLNSIKKVRRYVRDTLRQFDEGPAETRYEKGYEGAIEELARLVGRERLLLKRKRTRTP